jgi:hypothetical protein
MLKPEFFWHHKKDSKHINYGAAGVGEGRPVVRSTMGPVVSKMKREKRPDALLPAWSDCSAFDLFE